MTPDQNLIKIPLGRHGNDDGARAWDTVGVVNFYGSFVQVHVSTRPAISRHGACAYCIQLPSYGICDSRLCRLHLAHILLYAADFVRTPLTFAASQSSRTCTRILCSSLAVSTVAVACLVYRVGICVFVIAGVSSVHE